MNPDQRRIIRHLAVATERATLNPGSRATKGGSIAGERQFRLHDLIVRTMKHYPWITDVVAPPPHLCKLDDPVQLIVEQVKAQFKEGKLHHKPQDK